MFSFVSVSGSVLRDAAQALNQEQKKGRDSAWIHGPAGTEGRADGRTDGRTAPLLLDASRLNHKEVPDTNNACASRTAKVPFFPLQDCSLIFI